MPHPEKRVFDAEFGSAEVARSCVCVAHEELEFLVHLFSSIHLIDRALVFALVFEF